MFQILQNLLDDFISMAGRSPGTVGTPVTPQRMSFRPDRRRALSHGAMDGFSEFLPAASLHRYASRFPNNILLSI